VRWVFSAHVTDMLSGYRVLSRRFVKSFPTQTIGFGLETEMTVHALQLLMPTDEAITAYKERPPDSQSKLRTYRDGWRILMLIVTLARKSGRYGSSEASALCSRCSRSDSPYRCSSLTSKPAWCCVYPQRF
jgi:hypothetical protein